MKYLSIILLVIFFSCSKDEKCKNYFLITESNAMEAELKCLGLASNLGRFEVIKREGIGCLTGSEAQEARKGAVSVTRQMCTGVIFTVRTRIE
jgi:hypothetical protein